MKKMIIGTGLLALCIGILITVFRGPIENYVGKMSANYIINNPQVVEQSIMNLQAHKQKEEVAKGQKIVEEFGKDLFNQADGSPILGNKNGSVKMVVFMDPFCGYCRRFHKVIEQAIQKENNLMVIVREIPFISDKSDLVIRAMLAANAQGKYKQLQDAMYNTDPSVTENDIIGLAKAVNLDSQQLMQDMQRAEFKDLIKRNLQLAQQIHISGTPTFIMNGQIYPGAVSFEALTEMIQQKGETAPQKN